MSVRCTIDIETENLARLLGLLSPTVPTPVAEPAPARFKGTQAALEILCYELCSCRCERSKIPAIKRLRELTGLGLKEAKDAVETLDVAFVFGLQQS